MGKFPSPFGDDKNDSSILPYARQWLDESDISAVTGVLQSDFLTQGPVVGEFETSLCESTGAAHAVAVSSGTAALHLASLALGLGPGRTGVTSAITFAASANCFLYTGAKAQFCDVDPIIGLMTPALLDETLQKVAGVGAQPGVVIAVSLTGSAPNLAGLQDVCAEHGWALLEDAAHSLGGSYTVGSERFQSASCVHTHAAILSFHPVKHVCAGEGGAVLTNDPGLAARVRRLRSHGIERPARVDRPPEEGDWFQDQVELGFHYRLTDIQAALGLSQMKRLPAFVRRRREIACRYGEAFQAAPFQKVMTAPPADSGHAWHLFVVHFRSASARLRAFDFLRGRGIQTQVHYKPVYRHTYYRRIDADFSLPGAEAWYAGCLSLPLYPRMSDADVDRVIAAVAAFAETL